MSFADFDEKIKGIEEHGITDRIGVQQQSLRLKEILVAKKRKKNYYKEEQNEKLSKYWILNQLI